MIKREKKIKSNINQGLIASYNGIEIPKTIEIKKENMYFTYSSEREACQKIKDAKEKANSEMTPANIDIQPKIFNYHVNSENGLYAQRTTWSICRTSCSY